MNDRKYNYLNKSKAIPCPVGCRYKAKNIVVTRGNNVHLKQVGEVDIVAQIQSYEDSVCLARMIERFMRGDDTALSRRKGFYGDVSGFTDNPAEVIGNTRSVVAAASSAAAKKSGGGVTSPVSAPAALNEGGDVNV